MFTEYAKLFGLITISSLVLSGCGGGNANFCGYDAFGNPLYCQANPTLPPLLPPVASTSSFAITQGLINIANQSYSFNVSSADSYGNIYTLNYSSNPGQISTFGTTQASTASINQFLYVNSGLMQSVSSTNYFIPSPYQFLGSETVRPGGSEVGNTWQTPPVMGTVGQSFPSLTATLYHDSTNTVIDATLTETIGLSPDTATTALLCLIDTVQLTQAGINDNLSAVPSSNCFRIDPSGNVLGMQITTQVNGISMLFY